MTTKTLSQALQSIHSSAKELILDAVTPPPGSMIVGGKTVTALAKPLIDYSRALQDVKAQAVFQRQLLRQKKPKKCYGEVRSRWEDERQIVERYISYDYPLMTEAEIEATDQLTRPLPRETIIDIITRYLAVHKRMQVTDDKRAILLADTADMLFGLPEYAIVLAVFEYIEDSKVPWFPLASEIKDTAKKYLVEWPKDGEKDGWQRC